MSVAIWRLAGVGPGIGADDLSGRMAERFCGRWNTAGTPMVYCSDSIAHAILEVIGHFRTDQAERTRFVVRVDVPDSVWCDCGSMNVVPEWDQQPYGNASQHAGSAWAVGKSSALMRVPSALVPEENNILINPLHPDAARLRATVIRAWVPFSFLTKKENSHDEQS